ncbi:Gldg family protein [Kiritimatiella glycovorans]|uniref:Gliding-associated putative ABC transporter substrate-binding component GldG n=1 Tax=Kiritimatiella glycovorans TaxID=1307763 RepID=A0A0G3ELN3_9BACT|nr:Gldg family protein [Kiritimatiella glycovorans]AKJ65705.1 gliding-associated putative ABC transporter substrate-binding component GldG [Kiritimatiella glycovorans]
MSGRASQYHRLAGVTGVFLVLAIVVALNVVFAPLRLRSDMTAENLYTLSEGTGEILSELPRTVTLKFFFSRSNEDTPVALRQYADRVYDLLQEYRARSGGRIILEKYDPKPDSDAEEWAMRYGLESQSVDPFSPAGLYFGVVAVSGKQEAVLPFLAPQMEPRLEYHLTRMLYEVTREDQPVLGVLSPLPVMGAPRNPYNPQQRGGGPWALVEELRKQVEVRRVETSAETIPEDLDALLLVHPAGLSEKTLYAIDQFVLRGGRLLAFTDPMCLVQQMTSPMGGMQAMQQGMASNLDRLTGGWGIRSAQGVVWDPALGSMVGAGQGRAERNNTFLSVRESGFDPEDPATSGLNFMLMPFAGAFDVTPKDGVEVDRLIESSGDARLQQGMQAQFGGGRPAGAAETRTLALRVSGSFASAFPDGPPEDPQAAGEEDGNGEPEEQTQETEAHIDQSDGDAIAVLVGDADMLYDRFCIEEMNFFGQTTSRPLNDNLNFALNLVEQITGSEALIGLRSRGSYDRPFTKVRELERRAEERWKAEEERLQQELRELQGRLRELQRAREDQQEYILSPEQKDEIEKFRTKRFEIQQQLKEVRKNLRRDIEKLGLMLKVINIGAVPLVVAVFGVVHGIRRRRAGR